MRELNPNLRPPNGYKFTDANGVVHESDKVSTLAEIVGRHRARAGFVVGDPMTDILDQICGKHPRFCREAAASEAPSEKSFAVVVAHFIRKEIMSPPRVPNVNEEEATRRAAICSDCPQRVNWAQSCPPCMSGVRKFIPRAVRPGKVLPGTESQACKLGLDSIAIAVYRSKMKKIFGAPPACWRAE